VRTLLVSTTLFVTVVTAVSLGVSSGYATVIGILYAFGHRARSDQDPAAVLTREVPAGQP